MAFRKIHCRVLMALLSAFLSFAMLVLLDGIWVRASARALIKSRKRFARPQTLNGKSGGGGASPC